MITSPESQIAPLDPARRARLARLRTTLVHDWLVAMRGGEWVLASLLRLFPAARVSTLFYDPRPLDRALNQHAIFPYRLSSLPGVKRYYRWLLPALPWAVGRLEIDEDSDLVLATSHCVAHGAPAPSRAQRINYYFSPMRYLYDQQEVYRETGALAGRGLRVVSPRLQRWDREAASRADYRWAISEFVGRRIEAAWGLSADVVYPPVRTRVFVPNPAARRVAEDLMVTALVPYKRVEVAIEAANRLKRPLRIVGGGPLLGRLRRLAGPTVALEGHVSEKRLLELYQTRRALIFTAEEDFGLTPLEAMACGMPVLALRGGGVLETMRDGVHGQFFDAPEITTLQQAWEAFDPAGYDPQALRCQAELFSEDRFEATVGNKIAQILNL